MDLTHLDLADLNALLGIDPLVRVAHRSHALARVVEASEAAGVMFLLDGLAVESLAELRVLVEQGRCWKETQDGIRGLMGAPLTPAGASPVPAAPPGPARAEKPSQDVLPDRLGPDDPLARLVPEGARVYTSHYREVGPWAGDRYLPVSSGGSTFVTVVLRDLRADTGRAVCRPDEAYNPKLGRRIALGRALKRLQLRDEALALNPARPDERDRLLALRAKLGLPTLPLHANLKEGL